MVLIRFEVLAFDAALTVIEKLATPCFDSVGITLLTTFKRKLCSDNKMIIPIRLC